MNEERLDKLIDSFVEYLKNADDDFGFDLRIERKAYYQSFDYNKIINMTREELLEYIKKLWSVMAIAANGIIEKNGFDNFKNNLANLLYGKGTMQDRFNEFNNNIVVFKVKAMSEVLSLNYPSDYMIWDSKVESVFNLIGINDITPVDSNYDYDWYQKIMKYGDIIRRKISDRMGSEVDFLDADYLYEYVASKDLDYKKLDRVVKSYLTNLDNYLPEEIYKWEAVECFKENWDIEATNLVEMIEKSFKKAGNLLSGFNYYSYRMIHEFADKDPDTVREMFKKLFDEGISFKDRLKFFESKSSELISKYWDKPFNHYQDLHAVSVYLTFMYPEKYYIYKFSIVKKAANYLSFDISPSDKKLDKVTKNSIIYANYLKLCDRILDFIKDYPVLSTSVKAFGVTNDNYNMFAQDLLHYIATKYMGTKYWILAPNPGNTNCWEEFKNNNVIRVGWDNVGDLTEYDDKQSFVDRLNEVYGGSGSRTNDAKALYDFVYEMNVGDYVLIKNGKYNMYGYGKVKSDYIYDGQNKREIEWIKTGNFDMQDLAPEGGFALKTLTDITTYEDGEWAKRMINRMEEKNTDKVIESIDKDLINYYWLTCNPKIWSFSDCSVGDTQTFTSINENDNKRRIYANFESIKVGDRLIAYESNPVKAIVGLAEIVDKDENNNIKFKKIEHLASTISLDLLQKIDELKDMEVFKNHNGSLFRLTKDEYNCIYELIREDNSKPIQVEANELYDRDKFDEEVFLPMNIYDDIVSILNRKRNVILQGPPGVGKTYMAKKIAYSIMGEKDLNRIKVIQFHQSYSYEDFIEGYRPDEDSFKLKEGTFYKFCKLAENDIEKRPYFFIIDEINRGNLSKIFGELMVLLEKDKRSNTKLNLAYSDRLFTIPDNVYIIGMMNTADRSLAIMDYALRRRFSFVDIEPAFTFEKWNKYQEEINDPLFDRIISAIKEINEEIRRDSNLTSDCMIGHSYFSDLKNITKEELHTIVKYDILPLLKEYYIDSTQTYERYKNKLEGLFK